MFCNQCGQKLDDNATFCTACGNSIQPREGKAPTSGGTPAAYPAAPVPAAGAAAMPKKPVNKTVIVIITVSFVVLVTVISLLIYRSQFVSFGKFINDSLALEGYDGYATIAPSDVIDNESLLYSLGDVSLDYNWPIGDGTAVNFALVDGVSVELSKSENICNGDTVTATINVDYDVLNHKLRPQKKLRGQSTYTKEYTVEGLAAPNVFDPFEVITEVQYFQPDGKMTELYDTAYDKTFGAYRVCYYEDDRGHGLQIMNADNVEVKTLQIEADDDAYDETENIMLSLQDVSDKLLFPDGSLIAEAVSKEIAPKLLTPFTPDSTMTKVEFDRLKEDATELAKSKYQSPTFEKAYLLIDKSIATKQYNSICYVFSAPKAYNGVLMEGPYYMLVFYNSVMTYENGVVAPYSASSRDYYCDVRDFTNPQGYCRTLSEVESHLERDYNVYELSDKES